MFSLDHLDGNIRVMGGMRGRLQVAGPGLIAGPSLLTGPGPPLWSDHRRRQIPQSGEIVSQPERREGKKEVAQINVARISDFLHRVEEGKGSSDDLGVDSVAILKALGCSIFFFFLHQFIFAYRAPILEFVVAL